MASSVYIYIYICTFPKTLIGMFVFVHTGEWNKVTLFTCDKEGLALYFNIYNFSILLCLAMYYKNYPTIPVSSLSQLLVSQLVSASLSQLLRPDYHISQASLSQLDRPLYHN